MRVTSWNCFCGDVSGRLSELAPLRSDLITLQECSRPASDSASVIWRGTLPSKGVAVVSTEATLCLEFVEIPSLHSTVVPVRVEAPQPFVFVGVWTHPDYNEVAWKAMKACVPVDAAIPMDAQNAPTGIWKTAENAVSHSAHIPYFSCERNTEQQRLTQRS